MDTLDLTPDIQIGESFPPFIVAEIGINHNGNLDRAKKMIKIAKDIGVDAVKFQVKDVEEAHPKELLDMPYEGPNSFGKTYKFFLEKQMNIRHNNKFQSKTYLTDLL